MLSKSSTEFMSILYQFFKIGYGIGLVIICVAVICYAYRIISLNKKVEKAFRENKNAGKGKFKAVGAGRRACSNSNILREINNSNRRRNC